MAEQSHTPPARSHAHCVDDGSWAEFSRQYDGQPRTLPGMSDFALANAVFMAGREDLSLIHYQTAAKERIRWLSLRLASTVEALTNLVEAGSDASAEAYDEARDAIAKATGGAQ